MISNKDNKYLDLLEKRIRGKFIAIRTNKSSIQDAKIGILLNCLKSLDEPLYNKLFSEYKVIIEKVNNSNKVLISN